jgi:hypothetical protein
MNERKRGEEDKPRFLGLGFSYCLGSVFLDSLIFFCAVRFRFHGAGKRN